MYDWRRHRRRQSLAEDYSSAAALSLARGRTLTTVRAGLALNVVSCLVKGLIPLRALVAGLRWVEIFSNPGIVN